MAFPIILAAVAGAAKVLGGIADTNSQVGQYKTQSRVEAENARRLGLDASNAYSVGVRNEEQSRREYRDFAGTQIAGAAEGALSSSGSLLDIVRQSETRANLDALKIRHEGVSRGQALSDESKQATMRSELARKMAKRARLAGTLRTIGDIASTAGSIYSAGAGGAGAGAASKGSGAYSDLGLSGATRGYA